MLFLSDGYIKARLNLWVQANLRFVGAKGFDFAFQHNLLLVDSAAKLLLQILGNLLGGHCAKQPAAGARFCRALNGFALDFLAQLNRRFFFHIRFVLRRCRPVFQIVHRLGGGFNR